MYINMLTERERERERAHTYVRFTDDMLKHTARVLVHVYMRDFQSAQTYTCKMYIFTSMHIIIIYIYIHIFCVSTATYVCIYIHTTYINTCIVISVHVFVYTSLHYL